MLGMNRYPADYVHACHERVRSDTSAFRTGRAAAALEPVFFRNMLLALEMSFVHRLRGREGKDGNALNEVRVLCNSLLLHGGVMTREKGINLDPAVAVLGIAYGEEIRIDAPSFERLSEAFFSELRAKFV